MIEMVPDGNCNLPLASVSFSYLGVNVLLLRNSKDNGMETTRGKINRKTCKRVGIDNFPVGDGKLANVMEGGRIGIVWDCLKRMMGFYADISMLFCIHI